MLECFLARYKRFYGNSRVIPSFFGVCNMAFARSVNDWFVGQSDEMVFLSSENKFFWRFFEIFFQKISKNRQKNLFSLERKTTGSHEWSHHCREVVQKCS